MIQCRMTQGCILVVNAVMSEDKLLLWKLPIVTQYNHEHRSPLSSIVKRRNAEGDSGVIEL